MSDSKQCSHCGTIYTGGADIKRNFRVSKGPNGKEYIRSRCKSCVNVYYMKYYHKNKKVKGLTKEEHRVMIENGKKMCKGCGMILDLPLFNRQAKGFMGWNSKCRQCVHAKYKSKTTKETN